MMPWEPNAYTPNLAKRQQTETEPLVRTDLKCADLQDSMKRAQDFSSSDSELDDSTEVEKESTEENENTCFSKNETLPSMSQARKRRRGIVEKRRRDRINNSLSELRRLVPSALEKQGSTKLEKAEILQMTVDHLKFLHAAGGKGYFEVQSLAMDYRNFGFRECLAEVARYLSMVEGLNASDPLQVRLVSHLSSYASQREVHSGPGHTAWATGFRSPLPAHHHPLPVPKKQTQQSLSPVGLRTSSSPPSTSPAHLPLSSRLSGSGSSPSLSKSGSSQILPSGSGHDLTACMAAKLPLLLPSTLSPLSAFSLSLGAFPLFAPSVSPAAEGTAAVKRPFRPWGTEIGAF